MDKVIITTISDVGIIEAKYDLAEFSISLKTKADNLEEAKGQLKAKVNDALAALKALNMKLEKEVSTEVWNYKLEHREGSEKYAAGFQSVATMTFTVQVDEDLDDIYKLCLELDHNSPYPVFSLKDRVPILEKALVKAIENVKAKLAIECKLLGIDKTYLIIHSWSIGYGGALPDNGVINSFYNNVGIGRATGPQGMLGAPYEAMHNSVAATKLGSIYQELLDYVPLNPGVVGVSVPVQVNYAMV
jgi:hypothetical protein